MKLSILTLTSLLGVTNAFAGLKSPSTTTYTTSSTSMSPSTQLQSTRRESIERLLVGGASIAATTLLPNVAFAEPTDETPKIVTRMGGLLEKFQDGSRSIQILAPSGWNKFEGEVGAYDVKWQDLVDPKENIKISSTPVKSTTTSISALGTDVKAIGENLAAKRNASLVKYEERLTEGVLFYVFEFKINDGTHQLLSLSVNKGKIWSLDANTSEKRWSKREELYYNVVGSFLPKII